MKNIFILIIIIGAVYSYYKTDVVASLLASADAAEVTNQSGIKTLNTKGGADFDVQDLAVYGQVTVVDFYVSWCSACKKLTADYKRFTKARPDVAIRHVKMKDKWNVRWAKEQYGLDIKTTPHVLIFDAESVLLTQDQGNDKQGLKLLYKWMDAEVRKG